MNTMATARKPKLLTEDQYSKTYKVGDFVTKLFNVGDERAGEYEARVYDMAMISNLPVPKLLGTHQMVTGEMALDLEYVGQKHPLDLENEKEDYDADIEKMAQVHFEIHESAAFGITKLVDILRYQIVNSVFIQDVQMRRKLLDHLDYVTTAEHQMLHGNFQPENLIVKAKKMYVTNWVSAVSGTPSADVSKTYLLLQLKDKKLAQSYLKAYTKVAFVDKKDIAEWHPINALSILESGIVQDEKSSKALLKIVNDFVKEEE
jgi:hypothetical protein